MIGRFLSAIGPDADDIMVATKIGRRADPFAPETFTEQNLRGWVDRSRRNLGVDTLDLVQLHCPPTATYTDDAVFDVLDALQTREPLPGTGSRSRPAPRPSPRSPVPAWSVCRSS